MTAPAIRTAELALIYTKAGYGEPLTDDEREKALAARREFARVTPQTLAELFGALAIHCADEMAALESVAQSIGELTGLGDLGGWAIAAGYCQNAYSNLAAEIGEEQERAA